MVRLRLIHFNDLHGRLAEIGPDRVRPIFSRIAGLIRRGRDECARQPGTGLLVLAGGDELVGSPFAELAGSRPEQFVCHPAYRLYAAAGVDAGVIGNHELDWGLGMLSLAAARDATFPLLSANLVPAAGTPLPGVQPYTIITAGPLRVGVIGVTTPAEIKHLVPLEFELADPVAAVLDLLPAVRRASDLVVVLSHLGRSLADGTAVTAVAGDMELAAAMPPGAVALIVGSHTHMALNADGLDPANVINGIPIVQAGFQGRYVGEVLIDVGAGGTQVVDARLWPVEHLPEDPEFEAQHVAPLVAPVRRLFAEPLGLVTPHEDLVDERVAAGSGCGESALANFVADALAARCRAAGFPVDFAMVDASCLGAGLPQEGPLTFGCLFPLAPHADSIVLYRLPPEHLQALLDDNARRVHIEGEPEQERGFVQFSREVRYRIEGGGGPAVQRSALRAGSVTLDGASPAELRNARRDPLLIACGSFTRQSARAWEAEARENGLALLDLDALPHEVTRLALREELVAYVRQVGGVTEAAGLVRDGRVLGP